MVKGIFTERYDWILISILEREYFDEVDEDKNGKLDVSEVGQLIDPRDECIIEALVEQFIDEADADKDKNITFEGKFYKWNYSTKSFFQKWLVITSYYWIVMWLLMDPFDMTNYNKHWWTENNNRCKSYNEF